MVHIRLDQHYSVRVATLGTLGRIWSATMALRCLAASALFWANAVAMKAEMARRPWQPAYRRRPWRPA